MRRKTSELDVGVPKYILPSQSFQLIAGDPLRCWGSMWPFSTLVFMAKTDVGIIYQRLGIAFVDFVAWGSSDAPVVGVRS